MRNPEEQSMAEAIALLHDQPFCVSHDLVRNIRTLSRRFRNEGFSFLTKTLPSLGKAVDTALSGNVTFSLPSSFKRFKKTCFPHFLGSALRRVFDEAGSLLPEPCTMTVQWFRSFCYYAYKIEVPFKTAELDLFADRFIEGDRALGEFQVIRPDNIGLRNLMRDQLSSLEQGSANPAFGPGISSNCKREDKFLQFVPPSDLRDHFGRDFFHLSGEFSDVEFTVNFLSSYFASFIGTHFYRYEGFEPSLVLFVPKDSRGPRTICCEDSRLMYAQKSIQKHLYDQIERSAEFGGNVNFTDQSVNQKLTFDPGNATLDLKDASDRVHLDLVKDVFPPKLLKGMLACRSPKAALTIGGLKKVIMMKKFAPMGSALCFPTMAVLAYTAITSAIYLAGGPLPRRNKTVFVYGDDIIVPNEYAHISIEALNSIGFLVNVNKSFINSRFRESCGQDTLDQTTVTPLRKKKMLSGIKPGLHFGKRVWTDNSGAVPGIVALRNRAGANKFFNLQACLDDSLSELVKVVIPYGNDSSPYLCKVVADSDIHVFNEAAGYSVNGKLRAFRVIDQRIKIPHNSYSRLRRGLLEGGEEKPLNVLEIGARSTYLQSRTYIKWGTSYA